MAQFNLEILTPDGSVYNGGADSILVRTDDGDVEILKGHANYMASVGTGRVRIKNGEEKIFASVSGGFLSVFEGEVKLVAVTFEYAKDIDLTRAQKAKARAEQILASEKDEKLVKIAKAKLSRAISRINVSTMK